MRREERGFLFASFASAWSHENRGPPCQDVHVWVDRGAGGFQRAPIAPLYLRYTGFGTSGAMS